jgi:hypothetical protein
VYYDLFFFYWSHALSLYAYRLRRARGAPYYHLRIIFIIYFFLSILYLRRYLFDYLRYFFDALRRVINAGVAYSVFYLLK